MATKKKKKKKETIKRAWRLDRAERALELLDNGKTIQEIITELQISLRTYHRDIQLAKKSSVKVKEQCCLTLEQFCLLGLTLQEMSILLGSSPRMIRCYLDGTHSPPIELLANATELAEAIKNNPPAIALEILQKLIVEKEEQDQIKRKVKAETEQKNSIAKSIAESLSEPDRLATVLAQHLSQNKLAALYQALEKELGLPLPPN